MGSVDKYLSLPGERLLLAKRKHWFFLANRLFALSLLTFFVLFLLSVVFTLFFPSTTFLALSILILSLFVTTLSAKLIVDWYCHFYIVTTRKILEVCFYPLFSDCINEVLLDQVRCTEVDARRSGVINELLDIGDVMITFDRPTHQEECIISGIESPEEAGMFLTTALADKFRTNISQDFWLRRKAKPRVLRFTEEIFPGPALGVN